MNATIKSVLCVVSSGDCSLTCHSARRYRHIYQVDDVFGPDAQQTAAADITAARAVPVGRGGKRPVPHDALDTLKIFFFFFNKVLET